MLVHEIKIIILLLWMFQWVKFYHEHVLNKEPGAEKATPWHHDQSYYPINGDKVNYACIIYLEIIVFQNVKPCNLIGVAEEYTASAFTYLHYRGMYCLRLHIPSYRGIYCLRLHVPSYIGIYCLCLHIPSYRGIVYCLRLHIPSYRGIYCLCLHIPSYRGIYCLHIPSSTQ
jgi:hypothetical protein